MNSFQIGFLGLFFVGCLCTFSLWENPPEWRTPRQTEGGIFHRLYAELCYWIFRVDTWLLCRFIRFLMLAGVPVWLLNLCPHWLPGFIRRAGAREFLRRRSS
jgi:hypothetical protein